MDLCIHWIGACGRHHGLRHFRPFEPFFVDYVNTSPDDTAPEGLVFIKEADSPNGKALLVVSHEMSNTTTIFEITQN